MKEIVKFAAVLAIMVVGLRYAMHRVVEVTLENTAEGSVELADEFGKSPIPTIDFEANANLGSIGGVGGAGFGQQGSTPQDEPRFDNSGGE